LNPPNGAATSVLLYVLTKHVPASIFSATLRACRNKFLLKISPEICLSKH
jgi:hypothetical protein